MAVDFSLEQYIKCQMAWSLHTFGPGDRTQGILDHILKEVDEVKHGDAGEWIDIVILALDGLWRSGISPAQAIDMLVEKQNVNIERKWPDWRTQPLDKAIEHIRDSKPDDEWTYRGRNE